MGLSPDTIAGIVIACVAAGIGWGGTAYCWWHKSKVKQGEVSTVDKWLGSGKHGAGTGFAAAHAGYAMELDDRHPARTRDVERDAGIVPGVDTTAHPQMPPPVYSERDGNESRGRDREREARLSGDTERTATNDHPTTNLQTQAPAQ
jgi:hypothetical protein